MFLIVSALTHRKAAELVLTTVTSAADVRVRGAVLTKMSVVFR